jgi:hypothetical protein
MDTILAQANRTGPVKACWALLEAFERDETVVGERHHLSREFVRLQRFAGAPEWTRDRSVNRVQVAPTPVDD